MQSERLGQELEKELQEVRLEYKGTFFFHVAFVIVSLVLILNSFISE